MFKANGMTFQLPDGRSLFKGIDIEINKAELTPYDAGCSSLYGKTPKQYSIPVWRSKVMYVPQRPAIHPGTPMDLFNMASKYASQKGKPLDNPIRIGTDWNLSESHFYESWSNLSGGEMQRASLAIALALNPDILLLDGKQMIMYIHTHTLHLNLFFCCTMKNLHLHWTRIHAYWSRKP
ncbi:hypothetical protein BDB01DRAFT_726384 [Pilobolus umbonatus]|nr:hypothetical protein BDB01DRAFT_726384 [Pilobolus umbonatus]